MERNNLARICIVALTGAAWLGSGPPASVAGVDFHLQRHGTDTDTGYADFIAALVNRYDADFEPVESYPDDMPVPSLAMGDFQLNLEGDLDGPYDPVSFFSSAFNAESRVHHVALFAGYSLTITPAEGDQLNALGMWIFDDQRSLDSAYLIEVTETDGTVSTAVLVNEIERSSGGHEIEGFAGAVSDVGIAAMRVVAIDPVTQMPQADYMEVDHIIADMQEPPPPEPEEPAPTPTTCQRTAQRADRDGGFGFGNRVQSRLQNARDRWDNRQSDRNDRRQQSQCRGRDRDDDNDRNRGCRNGRR